MNIHPNKHGLFSGRNLFPTGGKHTDEPTEILLAPVTLWHRDEDFSSNLLTPQLKKRLSVLVGNWAVCSRYTDLKRRKKELQ